MDYRDKETVLAWARANRRLWLPAYERKSFPDWLDANWHIWIAFVEEADKAYAKRPKHWSARTIIHALQHWSLLNDAAGPWKLSNNRTPDLGRLYVAVYPERRDWLSFRGRKVLPGEPNLKA